MVSQPPAPGVSWRKYIPAAVLLVIAGAGFGYYKFSASGPASAPMGPPQGFAVPVEAVKVTIGPVVRSIAAVGSLRSNESTVLRPEVAGRVVDIRFTEGQAVRKGATLVRLDDAVNRADVAQIQANLTLSKQNYDRAEDLFQRGVGTARTRDEALAKWRADQAAMQQAQVRLAKLTIEAPFDGVIGLRRISPGDFVAIGQDLVNVEQLDPMKVDFRVPEIYLSSVAVGQKLAITSDAFPGKSFAGEIYAIDPQVDANGRSVVIRARVPNPNNQLRPGIFVRLALTLDEKPDAVQVPEQSLVPIGNDLFVFKVVGGKAAFTRVKTGARRDTLVEITEGLTAEDVVVTAGQIKIRDGAPVAVVPPGGGAPPAAKPAG